ncbi:hypothetical protein P3X46_002508 [Hevea brasiliensis]|uniref:Uncharacterized protein n=1 Tax=Hevea brasiliensis TaxID=3981 RepID=A0ABQ9N374_HEVBR|nr:hypothetical protein P3X46_002508 [Hevea brasiliensis]
MVASLEKFLFGFLMMSITLWMVFIFASRLLAWILSRTIGASVGFRVGGWKCLRDVVVKFKKGSVESISIGELRLGIRQSLVKLGVDFISRDPKLQVLICDFEVVMRSSSKGTHKTKTRKVRTRTSSQGKWTMLANIARFLSVSITNLVLKMPKAMVEVKGLRLDITKDGGNGSKLNLFVKLHILPIAIRMGEPCVSCDQSSNSDGGGCIFTGETSFGCEEFSLSCEFGLDREVGVIIHNLDIACGEVIVNLNEKVLLKRKTSDASSLTDKAVVNSAVVKDSQRKQSAIVAIIKYTSMIPQKVSFTLPKLDVKFVHQEHDLVFENNIMGIQLKSIKSRCTEDMGESTRLDVQMDFSEIHV